MAPEGASTHRLGQPASIPVIDMWSPIVPSAEIIAHVVEHFPPEQLPYLEVFMKRPTSMAEFRAYAQMLEQSDEQILTELTAAGIERSVITGFDEATSAGSTFVANEAVAAIASRHPNRFIPFCGVDILQAANARQAVEHWITERGFRGVSLRPFMIGLPANDRAYWPIYSLCEALQVPVSIHSSANWTHTRPSMLGHPAALDDVCCAFPHLTVIMSHGGYPWVLEAVLLARKHPNLHLELGAHRPKYFAVPGSGWEPLMRFGATTIAAKVLYGSGAFLLARPYEELTTEMRSLPLPADVLEMWLWKNAARVLGIDDLAA